MLKAGAGAMVAATLLMLGGCQKKEAAPTINEDMAQVMEPTAETIWDTMSQAYNDKGDGLVSTKLTEADWAKMADASARMKERALAMANAKRNIVATANQPIMGSQAVGQKTAAGPAWDPVGAQHVQAKIDANPALFTQKARDLADSADAMHRASIAKDVVLLYKAASNLDEVCDSCHEPFWGTDEPPPYPQ